MIENNKSPYPVIIFLSLVKASSHAVKWCMVKLSRSHAIQVPVREKVRKALAWVPNSCCVTLVSDLYHGLQKRHEISKFTSSTSSLVEYLEYALIIACFAVRILRYLRAKHINMGKLNVSMLRYLSSEEFRVLTAVSVKFSSASSRGF